MEELMKLKMEMENLKDRINGYGDRIRECEEITRSDEFKEFRKLNSMAYGLINGNTIPGMGNYKFPTLKGTSEKQRYSATKYRENYVRGNKERFKKLTEAFDYHERFNFGRLYQYKVSPQEYVCLFSSDAGDIYARGIPQCFDETYEFIEGSEYQDEYEGDENI